jgi:hypothetical protein
VDALAGGSHDQAPVESAGAPRDAVLIVGSLLFTLNRPWKPPSPHPRSNLTASGLNSRAGLLNSRMSVLVWRAPMLDWMVLMLDPTGDELHLVAR